MPILLRTDFDALQVRAAAKAAKDGPQVRRLLALASAIPSFFVKRNQEFKLLVTDYCLLAGLHQAIPSLAIEDEMPEFWRMSQFCQMAA